MSQFPVPPQQQPPFGQPAPHRGTLVLVLGILSIAINGCGIGIILGAIAMSMGGRDLRDMAAGLMDRSGEGLTRAGKICGIVGLILGCVSLVFTFLGVLFFLGMAAAGANHPHHHP